MTEEQFGQQEAASAGSNEGPEWLQNAQGQWKIFAGIALVITAVIVGGYWYVSNAEVKNEEASTHLSRIRGVFESGQFEAALTADTVSPVGQAKVLGLLDISSQYGDTDAGKVAALMAGNALANLGRFDEAQPQFDIANGSGTQVVEVGAMQGLAACKEASGDYEGAADMYEQAGQRGLKTGLEGACFYKAGLCYEKAGNTDKAGELYRTVAKKYEISEVAPSAKAGLARLGMAID